MNLSELAKEYFSSAERLAGRLEKLKAELSITRGEKSIELQKRIEVMKLEISDLRQLGHFLEEYYA